MHRGLRFGWRAAVLLAVVAQCHAADLADAVRVAASKVEGHPRLFMNAADVANLRDRVKTDATTAQLAAAITASATRMLDEPVSVRELRGRRMLSISRQALDRMLTLGMAWQLTGEPRFVDRASAELRAVAAFENWNPSHFLDTAEMTLAVAIGYDWFHAALDEQTRETARRAIFDLGLTPALARDHWWMKTDNNWNQVCHGGLLGGALVLLEHKPAAALEMIEHSVRNVPHAMASYAPLGAYPEGPGYWGYGTTYNVILLALLESALGTTFGLDELPGFAQTGAFPILMTGPSGKMFNFSDGGPERHAQPAVFWLSKKFQRPEWSRHEESLIDPAASIRGLMSLVLLWRQAPAATPDNIPGLPLHWTSRNHVPVAVHRESWDRKDALYVGIKAGPPSASHAQMDAGSFVFDAQGIRWAHDLGNENYHHAESQGITLWHKHQKAGRWTVFRNNNFSHNTLVIDGQLQYANGDSPIARFSADPAFPHSVVDMSRAYTGQADHVHRGVALLPGGALVVRDHLTGLRPGAEVRWSIVTRAKAQEPAGSSITLSEGGETLELTLHGAAPAWQAIGIDAPQNPWDSPNPGFSRVGFTAVAPANGVLDLAVVLRPGKREPATLEDKHLAPPMLWSAPAN